jgi:hypothetical protein
LVGEPRVSLKVSKESELVFRDALHPPCVRVIVKVAGVSSVKYCRNDRRLQYNKTRISLLAQLYQDLHARSDLYYRKLPAINFIPFELTEKFVIFNIFGSILEIIIILLI